LRDPPGFARDGNEDDEEIPLMLSTPVHTLEQRAIVIGLFARRFQSSDPLHVDTRQHAPLYPLHQIVTVRGNQVCRRRSLTLLAAADSSAKGVEAGRGWSRGAAWDAIDARSISERLNAAAPGGTDALVANLQLAAVIQDPALNMSAITGAGADEARPQVPVLV
jgi:hypothetical protein